MNALIFLFEPCQDIKLNIDIDVNNDLIWVKSLKKLVSEAITTVKVYFFFMSLCQSLLGDCKNIKFYCNNAIESNS